MAAREKKATKRPSAEIAGLTEMPFALAPSAPVARLTSVVVLVCRSRTNRSSSPVRSAGSRLSAKELKTRPGVRGLSEAFGFSADRCHVPSCCSGSGSEHQLAAITAARSLLARASPGKPSGVVSGRASTRCLELAESCGEVLEHRECDRRMLASQLQDGA